jgi:hypothetical protein
VQIQRISYTTQDLGLGAYYFHYPFKNMNFRLLAHIQNLTKR